jgi:hypothetical protein
VFGQNVQFGKYRNGPRWWRIHSWVTLQISVAALITGMTMSVGAAEPGEKSGNVRGRLQLAVWPFFEAEPSVPTELYARVGGPPEALPLRSYIRINDLPVSVTLSEGQKTPAGSWVVPIQALEELKLTVPVGLPERSEFTIALVAYDGTVLFERKIGLHVTPAVVPGRTDKKMNETQAPPIAISSAPSVASAPIPEPVSAGSPDRKSVAPVRPTLTREERAKAEKLVSQGERLVAEGNISIARQYFLRAAGLGLPIAALKMAETYDPSALVGVNVRGLVPDPVEARKWYGRALELGVPEAEARLQRLGRK